MVNGRPVNDMALRRVMVGVYSTMLPPGRFPVAVADIRLDPAAVDVNVHPQKHEVRFREPREVASLLYEAMSTVVDATPWIRAGGAAVGTVLSAYGGGLTDACGLSPAQAGQGAWPLDGLVRDQVQDGGFNGQAPSLPGIQSMTGNGLRYLGQVGNSVLVCAGEGSLVLVDQHAAHERINFNSLWAALESGQVPSDQLLFPEIVTLDPADMERFDSAFEALERLGFDLERYSGDSVAVRAVPSLIRGRSVDAMIREAFHAAGDAGQGSGDAVLRKIVSTVACHASVRAGDPLSDVEARTLLSSMEGEAKSAYCPHGRQAVVVHAIADILKSFDR
jgi:DNA mismatch repair protein MutL